MNMKKLLAIALVAVMALGLTACSGGDSKPAADNKKTNDTTTTTAASANPLVDD